MIENRTLKALMKIKSRLGNPRKDFIFQSLIDDNKVEIDFLKDEYELCEYEALIFAAACILSIEKDTTFDVVDLSLTLGTYNIEVLFYSYFIYSLVNKRFLVLSAKYENKNHMNILSVIDILNQEFSLHLSLGYRLS